MLPVYAVLLCLSVLTIFPQDVIGGCSMYTRQPTPQFLRKFGSKYLYSDADTPFESDQSVELYCPGGFNIDATSDYGSNFQLADTNVTFSCRNSKYFYVEIGDEITVDVTEVSCRGNMVSDMFESRKSLPGCGEHMTLVVGQDFGDMGSTKSLGICYDIVGLELKYVSYTAYPPRRRIIEKVQLGQLNELGLDINVAYTNSLFQSVSQSKIDDYVQQDNQLKQLLGGISFEHSSLVQDAAFGRQLHGFENILSIEWLRALLHNNWRHWVNALEAASLAAGGSKFDITQGVSGQLRLPRMPECNVSRIFRIELPNDRPLTVPTHIWAHVRDLLPTGKPQDEFVVIGQNSPFLTEKELNDFCPDMCDQVAWLKNSLFGILRHYSVFGLMQCCRVQDVAHKLDNFPGATAKPLSMGIAK